VGCNFLDVCMQCMLLSIILARECRQRVKRYFLKQTIIRMIHEQIWNSFIYKIHVILPMKISSFIPTPPSARSTSSQVHFCKKANLRPNYHLKLKKFLPGLFWKDSLGSVQNWRKYMSRVKS